MGVKSKSKPKPRAGGKSILLGALFVAAVALVLWATRHDHSPAPSPAPVEAAKPSAPEATVIAAYGQSASCKSCHEEAFGNWEYSHHALAERPLDLSKDVAAFEPPRQIRHQTQSSQARIAEGELQLVTRALDGATRPFYPGRVIGVFPLEQFLIPTTNGRWQATELALDPRTAEWFDIFGNEDRQPGEWGHWTGRGMNWNNMCATCHNTRVRKNYDERTDGYSTAMAEMGVGCEACHGPMADHNAWQAKNPNKPGDPTIRKISREEMFSVCGQCHARRAELTGDFHPGEKFNDHHTLTIPDETDLFYPDGQVREEDYEFTAFLGSRMQGRACAAWIATSRTRRSCVCRAT